MGHSFIFVAMNDEKFMRRCLELAQMGMGTVSPNPLVGAVVTLNGEIIGEGYHHEFGKAHAEVNAINNVYQRYGTDADTMLKEATVYCNLEPCAHFGKTPPCADLLVSKKVKRVVIGNTDTFDSVNGKGIEKLKNAGISVTTGVLANDCTYLNRRFFTRIEQHRPYIILKWAQTADGFFAPEDGTQQWITGEEVKQLNFKWRSQEDAILVGKGTALIDNPQLTARGFSKSPTRILIDRNLTTPLHYSIYDNEAKTIIINEIKSDKIDNNQFIQMEDMSFYLPQKVAYQLYLMDIQSVIIEGGKQLLDLFIKANLWDEARIFTGKDTWKKGIKAPSLNGKKLQSETIGNDKLTVYLPTK